MQDGINCGRGIKKHPRSIYIYVPIKKKVQKQIEGQQNINGTSFKQRNEEASIQIIDDISYKRMVIFDIEDTYVLKGQKPIPILDDKINGNTTKDLYEILHKVSKYPIYEEINTGGTKGYFSKSKGKIVIYKNMSQDEKTAVLIHELCHSLYDNFNYKTEREKSEIFVESVAFLVSDHYGFDTSMCSLGYIISWAKEDINEVFKLGNLIQKTANEFIETISKYQDNQIKISA